MGDPRGTSVELEEQRVLLQVEGEDRTSFLHGMLSNDVSGLTPGGGASALLLTEQGRVVAVAELVVLTDEILLDLTSAARDRLLPALERFIVADDVEFEDRPGLAVTVRGPQSAAFLDPWFEGVSCLAPGGHQTSREDSTEWLISRVDDLGGPAYRIWCPDRPAAEALVERCLTTGAVTLSAADRESIRIAAGIAAEDVDFDETTLAPEVPSLAHAISNRKGCYLGQEVVERVASRGKVKWLVAPLLVEGECAVGDELLHDGKQVGQLSSVSPAAQDGAFAAIARIRREVFDDGQAVRVRGKHGEVVAQPAPKSSRM